MFPYLETKCNASSQNDGNGRHDGNGEQFKSYLSRMKVQWEGEKFPEVLANSPNFSSCFSGTQMLMQVGNLPLAKTHMLLS